MINIYISAACPFCQKVLKAAQNIGLQEGTDYVTVDASIGTAGRAKVIEVGGKGMVPFMIDNEVSMYESDDIIDYLKKKSNAK